MVNSLIGNVEPFVPGGNFKAYEDRIKQFMIVNSIEDAKKTALFITVMGADVYEVLVSLSVPALPSTLSFNQILKKLNAHFKPQINKRAERYKFSKMVQESGEVISDFVVRLKAAAQLCEFGDFLTGEGEAFKIATLENALIDRFIAGLSDDRIQQKLLNDTSDEFESISSLAISMEITQREVRAMKPLTQHAVDVAETYAVRDGQAQRFRPCRRCGRRHNEQNCPAVNWECFTCLQKGHTSVVCRKKKADGNPKDARGSGSNNNNNYPRKSTGKAHVKAIYQVPSSESQHKIQQKPIIVVNSSSIVSPAFTKNIFVNGKNIDMEIDSGAVLSLMSYREYIENFSQIKVKQCAYNLVTVTGEQINVASIISVSVRGATQTKQLDLVVTRGNHEYTPLLGRAWLDVLYPDWRKNMFATDLSVKAVCTLPKNIDIVSTIPKTFPKIVDESADQSILHCEAELVLKDSAVPIFHAPYSVPFKLRDRVKDEIDKLVVRGILIPVTHSDWATPIVIVPKSDSELRICMDCKVTINRMIQTEHYPLPKIADIFASLSSARVFCVIDLKGAYQQIVVSKRSQELLTINTIFGLYRYTRLPFGVSSAPSIFQQEMDKLLSGLSRVHCYLDDIIIGGKNEHECRESLLEVLNRLNDHHVQINLKKCRFLVKSVSYLGHVLSHGEIRPNPEKVKAITNARAPRNVKELQSYLGLLNYYGKFIPNLSAEVNCLYSLTKKDVEFLWSQDCEESFNKSKKLVTSESVLELYDPDKQIIVASDASPIGLGAIMSHEINGRDRPVLFASSSLSKAQQGYSQIHREALAIIFAVSKFHDYIYGHTFILHTDQQALSEIFHPTRGTSGVAAARLQRWSIILSAYKYQIKHRSAAKMTHVDALSRLPLTEEVEVESVNINFFRHSGELIDRKLISRRTLEDKKLSKVFDYVANGWPKLNVIDVNILPFAKKQNSLALEDGCIFYGNNIVIPNSLQKVVLELLHENHVGIVKMKLIARSYVWWPALQGDIENYAHNCDICQSTRNVPKEIVKTTWPSTSYPFERIHLDFFHLRGTTFLILVDSYSKFVEISIMQSTVVSALIKKLTIFFSLFGLPHKMVSDNGPPFNSAVLRKYCESNGIVFLNSPPYHAQSNGLAERGVQTAKKALIRFCLGEENALSMQEKIDKYLMLYRNSPSIELGRSPAEVIFAYKPKMKLDFINDFLLRKCNTDINVRKGNDNIRNDLEDKTARSSFKEKTFKVGESVFYRCHFKNWIKWLPAVIKRQVSPVTYLIEINGTIRFVQENQIRYPSKQDKHSLICLPNKDLVETHEENVNEEALALEDDVDMQSVSSLSEENVPVMNNHDNHDVSTSSATESDQTVNIDVNPGTKRKHTRPTEQLRRSRRNRKRVRRFGNNIFDF